jgi:gas vesicle protein
MNEGNGYSGVHVVLAFLAGALVGTSVALLSAPQSGRETRGAIGGWARDTGGRATRLPVALKNAYVRATDAAKTAFNEALSERTEEQG